MDKINLVSSFQKSIEALKNTECSQKEKLGHFANITDFITSPSTQTHPNQIKFISNALAVLLMFCEEMDSTVHLNAEENVNKIIRFCEKTFIVRIQYDLYHEIKKNGNERSLRICLNIFGYYCHLIKQRKVKPYATNFLPCIYAISKRKETQLIETLSEFLKTFCKFMENCLSDRDILKLVEVFLNDTASECAIKRRCASQNVMTLIMNSKKPEFICRQAFNKSLDILASDQTINAVIGVLGMLRLLIPELSNKENYDFFKIIQILDVCLQLLHDKSHSIINASLEVIHAILRCNHNALKAFLISKDHIDIIRQEDSLRNLIFRKNGSKISSSKINEIDKHYFEMNSSRELESSIFSKDTQILDEGCLSCTDIEMDSLKSIDSSHETENIKKKSDTASLKSQKSTESFGSFFNSLLSQSKPTETVTKFFRSQGSSLNNTPKKSHIEDITSLKDFVEDDVISAGSLDSNVSIHSNDSSPVVIPSNENDETVTVVETELVPSPDQPSSHQLSQPTLDIQFLPTESFKLDESTESMKSKEMTIGSIYDQFLIEYVVRLVCYKFLLSGQDQKLKLDNIVRVSIKNLSLIVLSDCVRIYPQVLLMKLAVPHKETIPDECCEKIFEDISDLCLAEKSKCRDDVLLDIKPDHFGTSTWPCSLDEFLSPLTESGVSAMKTANDIVKDTSNTAVISDSFVSESHDLEVDKSDQSIEDVLLYFNHNDPSLRGNVQSIVGNFVVAVLEDYRSIDEFCEIFGCNTENNINLDLLLKVLMKGLSDDIHTVIKHSLSAIDLSFSLILSALTNRQMKFDDTKFLNVRDLNDLTAVSKEVIRIDQILDELLITGSNKNWVVQSTYCGLVTNIDFNEIRMIMGDDLGWYYENKFLDSIYSLIGDQDSRTRSRAIQCLCHYVEQEKEHKYNKNYAISNFVCARIFNKLPLSFGNFKMENVDGSVRLQRKLGKVLYTLSNKLMELDDRNQQFGIVSTIAALVKIFNPIKYHSMWNEFNIFEVCLNFMCENYSIGIDATCQCDLINICTSLIAGNAFHLKYIWSNQITTLLLHVLKLMNIFYHVFNNIRPLYIPKGQKNDIFISTKEFQLFESFGYFGNDYFYLRIYKLLRQSFDSYKISIAKDSGQIIMDLLSTTLNSLIVILEIKIKSNPIKLIEETLMYLSTLINYAPMESEFLARNVIENGCYESDVTDVTTILREVLRNLSNSSVTSGENAVHILLFKPIVIRCLKIFSKSDCSIQSAILDMLCQALEFNVNYSLLDANNVFLDFVLKLSELIETGAVRDSEVVVPSIIKFLFCLTKEKDRKLITIPKIINITDTFLANDVKSGSRALNELAFKFFFDESVCDDADFSIKDINTQKEVALRMLIKFLHIKEIQNSLCIILMLQRSTTSDNENSFYVNLLQVIDDNQGLFLDVEQFHSIDLCFKVLSLTTVMEKSNLRKAFSLFYKCVNQKEMSIETMSVISILIENVLNKMTEENVLKQIEEYLQERRESVTSDATSFFKDSIYGFITFAIEFIRCSHKELYFNEDYKKQARKLFEMLLKFQFGVGNLNSFRTGLSTQFFNTNFMMTSLNKFHSSVQKLFIEFLFEIECNRLAILNILVDFKKPTASCLVPMVMNAYNEAEDIRDDEIGFILKHLNTFLISGQRLLTKIINNSKHFGELMERIHTLTESQLSKETQQSIYLLLSACNVLENYPKVIETTIKCVKLFKFANLKVQAEELIFERLSALSVLDGDITKLLPRNTFTLLEQLCENEDVHYSSRDLIRSLQPFYGSVARCDADEIMVSDNTGIVDGSWLIEQINYNSFNTHKNNKALAELLFDISEK